LLLKNKLYFYKDDIDAIQSLYGKNQGIYSAEEKPTTRYLKVI